MERDQKNPEKERIMPDVIFSYTQDQAIEDGVLVLVGYVALGLGKKPERVIFTRTLFEDGYTEEEKRRKLLIRGFSLLLLPNPEDSPTMKLRVIERNRIWIIWNEGKGFTFLTPEDY